MAMVPETGGGTGGHVAAAASGGIPTWIDPVPPLYPEQSLVHRPPEKIVTLVYGPPGAGKTNLLEEYARSGRRSDRRRVVFSVSDRSVRLPKDELAGQIDAFLRRHSVDRRGLLPLTDPTRDQALQNWVGPGYSEHGAMLWGDVPGLPLAPFVQGARERRVAHPDTSLPEIVRILGEMATDWDLEFAIVVDGLDFTTSAFMNEIVALSRHDKTAGLNEHSKLRDLAVRFIGAGGPQLPKRFGNQGGNMANVDDRSLGTATDAALSKQLDRLSGRHGHHVEDPARAAILAAAGGNRGRLDKIMDEVAVTRPAVVTAALVQQARDRLSRRSRATFAARWGGLLRSDHAEAALLRAIASRPGGLPIWNRAPELWGDPTTNAAWREAKSELEMRGLIHYDGGSFVLSDPLFADWIRDEVLHTGPEVTLARTAPAHRAFLDQVRSAGPAGLEVSVDPNETASVQSLFESDALTHVVQLESRGLVDVQFASPGRRRIVATSNAGDRVDDPPRIPTGHGGVALVGPDGQHKMRALEEHGAAARDDGALWLNLAPKPDVGLPVLLKSELDKADAWLVAERGPIARTDVDLPRLDHLKKRLASGASEERVRRLGLRFFLGRIARTRERYHQDLAEGNVTSLAVLEFLGDRAREMGSKVVLSYPGLSVADKPFLAEIVEQRRFVAARGLPIQIVIAGDTDLLTDLQEASHQQGADPIDLFPVVEFAPHSVHQLIDRLDQALASCGRTITDDLAQVAARASDGSPATLDAIVTALSAGTADGRAVHDAELDAAIQHVHDGRRREAKERYDAMPGSAQQLLDDVARQGDRGLARSDDGGGGLDRDWDRLIASELVVEERPLGQLPRLRAIGPLRRLLERDAHLRPDPFAADWQRCDHDQRLVLLELHGAGEGGVTVRHGSGRSRVLEALERRGLVSITDEVVGRVPRGADAARAGVTGQGLSRTATLVHGLGAWLDDNHQRAGEAYRAAFGQLSPAPAVGASGIDSRRSVGDPPRDVWQPPVPGLGGSYGGLGAGSGF